MYITPGSSTDLRLVNNSFVDNVAGGVGGAIGGTTVDGSIELLHNTFHGNVAGSEAGGAKLCFTTVTIVNSIFWGNEAEDHPELVLGSIGPTHVTLRHSNVRGGQADVSLSSSTTLSWGPGMIDADPRWVDPVGGQLRLSVKSPCIDAGDGAAPGLPTFDLDGDPRALDGDGDGIPVVDMGADEIPVRSVPAIYGSIQAAILAATDGDHVAVGPGTYPEHLDFLGKAITVESTGGAAATVVSGSTSGPVVAFASGEGREARLVDLTLTQGSAPRGGGVRIVGASPTLVRNRITANTATVGGGVSCVGGAPLLIENRIDGNQAERGGGVAAEGGAAPELERTTIEQNQAAVAGGGAWAAAASLAIRACLVRANQAVVGGGAAFEGGTGVMTNSVVRSNTADTGGGISADAASNVTLTNDDVLENTAATAAGGLDLSGAATVVNSIVWGNLAPIGAQLRGAVAAVTHCDVQGGWPGPGNIDADPEFVDSANGDHRLGNGSPCIDAGDDLAPALPPTDAEGEPRLAYLGVDIGIDENHLGGVTLLVPGQYPTIQGAIDAAHDGDVVRVAPGLYLENIDFLGKDVTVESEAGAHATVIDGQQAGSVVRMLSGEGPGAVLRGFTLQNGSGSKLFSAHHVGGGVVCRYGSPTIERNVVRDCHVDGHGGGLSAEYGKPVIRDNVFSGNSAALRGGAIYLSGQESSVFPRNKFVANEATHGGALRASYHAFVDCTFVGNVAGETGGAAEVSSCTFVNSTFSGNHSLVGGACDAPGTSFTNCSFTGNQAEVGGALHSSSTLAVTNCILWNDFAPQGPEIALTQFLWSCGSLSLADSLVQGGQAAVHVEAGCSIAAWSQSIDADPRFVDAVAHDLHLRADSPAVDLANPGAADLPPADFEGDPRTAGSAPDLGADEFFRHLYVVGDPAPGAPIVVRIVGVPSSTPVALFVGGGLLAAGPLVSPWGDWLLDAPVLGPILLGAVPSDGVVSLPATLPPAPPGPYSIALQAIVGAELTNAAVMIVP